ncbi:MAG: alpha/beta hydrolase [Cytophagales bacterium]|nr:alpha/beta hydrolase [Cytophagales bacterium]
MLLLIGCSTQKKEKAESSPDLFNKGVKINYRVSGNGDTTLLFVHGWCIDQTYWDNQVNYFSNNYKVVTLDLPGHGKSGRERTLWTIENYGSDVSMIMDALDLKNIVLVGHSMGGNIILEAANRNQQKVIGFIGVDNFKDLGAEYSEEQAAEFDGFIKTIRQDYKGTAGGFAEGMLFSETTDKSIKERVINDILNADPEIAVPILESLIKLNVKERGLMQQLPLKVHLINSDVIPTNKAQLEKYCTGSYEIYSIGLTGHYPMIEASDRFNRILEGILHNL